MSLAYLNGNYQPLAETKVSVMDRGFLFGDGVYEVVPVYGRKPFRLREHLARLQASLDGVRITNPLNAAEWDVVIDRISSAAAFADQQVCIQVTRGAGPVRNHAFPAEVTPTVLVFAEELLPPKAELLAGVRAVSAADIRWLRCNLKTTSLLANCLLRQLAVDAGCAETVLFRDGILTEGAAANIFAVKDGVLLAPQKNHLMLPGITYDVILEIAAARGMPHVVRDITEAEVRSADELLMSSSTREALPIVELDGRAVGTGRPGPVGQALIAAYQDFKRTVMYGKD
ncbi:MAG TPA: D-amino acid aminotransferase [Rhodocyclaceae bacterium]